MTETDAISNFSQAYFGLARIAIAKNKPDEAFVVVANEHREESEQHGGVPAFCA